VESFRRAPMLRAFEATPANGHALQVHWHPSDTAHAVDQNMSQNSPHNSNTLCSLLSPSACNELQCKAGMLADSRCLHVTSFATLLQEMLY